MYNFLDIYLSIIPVNSSTVLVGTLAKFSFFTLPTGNIPCCTSDKAFLRAILNSFFLSIFSLKIILPVRMYY